MRKKHLITLKAIFHEPILSNVVWKDIEVLFEALGAEWKKAVAQEFESYSIIR